MEQKSTSNVDPVHQLIAEIRSLEIKKRQLQLKLKLLQDGCNHDFLETAFIRKCKKCNWTESLYY
ncbi:MAG: hypothetical protein ACK4M9_11780 [Anaerobacillus sp.]|uniref:hypothetical protein n=1 Tax=Anaerobacillus sp. TaxID=1872506 RepID=UPI00391C5315